MPDPIPLDCYNPSGNAPETAQAVGRLRFEWETLAETFTSMLHDSLTPQEHGHDTTDDRRRSPRTAQRAELVVRWHHAPDTPIRYRVLDVGDGGVRILSALPLLRGLTGTAIKLLPKGESINRPCKVSWARPPALTGPFEIGLNFA